MAIKNHSDIKKKEIDLTGPEGNAFLLLSYARSLCEDLGLGWLAVRAEMTATDYENLIKVFDKYFGEYVDLVR